MSYQFVFVKLNLILGFIFINEGTQATQWTNFFKEIAEVYRRYSLYILHRLTNDTEKTLI